MFFFLFADPGLESFKFYLCVLYYGRKIQNEHIVLQIVNIVSIVIFTL